MPSVRLLVLLVAATLTGGGVSVLDYTLGGDLNARHQGVRNAPVLGSGWRVQRLLLGEAA